MLDWILREIRKHVNPKRMCDECLREYTWQTKDGRMLCERCNDRRKKELDILE